jgi:ligand-binding sensor domain-containing protein/signal transduction histidine kinase/DNA-binding response OmpR family regulator
MNRWISFILLFVFSILIAEAATSKIRFSHITNKDGLPSNTVFSIMQDYKGYYWFGTKAGLCRYDGQTIVKYEHQFNDSTSLPGNLVHCTYQDSKKNLWVSTITGVAIFDRTNNKFQTINRKLIIRDIIETKDGKIFAASSVGLKVYDPAVRDFVSYKSENNLEINNFCTSLVIDDSERLWVGSTSGLFQINLEGNTVSHYKSNPANPNALISNNIFHLYIDSGKRLWIGTGNKGICYFDQQSGNFVQVKGLSNDYVHCVTEDDFGRLWVGTERGLNIYNPATKKMQIFLHNLSDKNSINDNAIHSIYFDNYKNMLVGTYFGGVNLSLKIYQQFNIYESGDSRQYISGKAVRQIIGDNQDNMWIATEDGGLNYFDKKHDAFKVYKQVPGQNSLSYDNVHSIMLDRDGDLWVGTFLGGLNKLEKSSQRFTLYNREKYPVFNVDNVFAILQDKSGLIWIATSNGVLTYNKRTNEFKQFEPDIFFNETVNVLLEDSKGEIWLGSRNLGAFKYNKEMNNLKNYRPGRRNSISDLFINYLYEDHEKNIWIATHNGGLNLLNTKTDSITIFRTTEGLPSNTIFSLIQDDDKNLWITTNNGLSKYDLIHRVFSNFTVQEGLPNNQFNYNSAHKDRDGRLYFGTIDGLISFDPQALVMPHSKAAIDITDFKIMGKSVVPDDPESPIKKSINEVEEIVLTSEQAKFISFEFTLPTLFYSKNLSFDIKMTNSDQDWINMGTQRQVSFSNLSPGDYTFMLKVADNISWADTDVRSIRIKVLPPFWRTDLAYVIYTLLLLGIAFYYNRHMNKKREEERAALKEKNEKERIKEINRLKLNFFTNVSHELNTPLTLIISPIQNLLTQFNLSPDLEEKLRMIRRNAERMKHLIEELISLGKIETEEEKITVHEGYALRFILELGNGFRSWAESKKIHFTMDITVAKYPVYFDSVKVEKIVYNLLSNAFKYTEPQGEVKLSAGYFLENGLKMLRIQVEDTGRGISEKNLHKIFEKYYQISDHDKNSGFGIGLNLVKQLVASHKGRIDVKSEIGKGSKFTVVLNVDVKSYEEHEKSESKFDNEQIVSYQYLVPDVLENELINPVANQAVDNQHKSDEMPYLLVVEDNPDMLQFIGSIFEADYQIKLCTNGKEAFAAALETTPDLIISDLMMPEMDGLELCRLMKTSIETCHIPFIMLTAKAGDDNVAEGYEYGADFYIKKPFNAAILVQQVKNILTTQENQRNYFRENTDSVFESAVINSRDKKLLETINEHIMNHLSEENYSIVNLTKDLGISRTLLHTKLKGLVGMSATEYINKVKLKEGLRLLQEGNNISEVSYITGFASPSYFSRCFKKVYGTSPREFMKKD